MGEISSFKYEFRRPSRLMSDTFSTPFGGSSDVWSALMDYAKNKDENVPMNMFLNKKKAKDDIFKLMLGK